MDPDEALRVVRNMASYVVECSEAGDDSIPLDTAVGLAEAFLALDGWLSKGGHPPVPWTPPGMHQAPF